MSCRLALVPLLAGLLTLALAADDKPPPPTGPDKETQGLEDALRRLHAPLAGGDPLSPKESHAKLKAVDGLAVDLVAHEPLVRQPLALSFDESGRMWVMNYIQYPFPSGLKIVSYDQYIRAKFDKVPPPPPKHFRGDDRITLHAFNKDGTIGRSKTFVDGLNIATSVAFGRGGVWVMNPPYLLFYPDKDRDDVADGDPVVHLSGFGLEDTHAVASSLAWGPDGWLYGTQGSTCTARVKVEIGGGKGPTTDFLGQAIWRYHPERHEFELFAEGGGNTFGLEFDDTGRAFSGTNWGAFRGLYFVQGGYYVKGWGKHGPLTNPYALGFFEHMPHKGNGDRLTHTYVVYGGTTLPKQYHGKIIGPSPLQKRIQVTRLEPNLSSYRTEEEPFLMTSDDGWFRPVDCKVGPDGALYVADFYENRISHVDPRDNWHRDTGRIYRIRSKDTKSWESFDLGQLTSKELVALLASPSRWHRQTALRLLGDRKDAAVAPQLRELLRREKGQTALEAMWALHQVGAMNEELALEALEHVNPAVRRWTVRLLGDDRTVSATLGKKLIGLAEKEQDAQVRSQLASSAKRIRGTTGLKIVAELLKRDEDVRDPHIGLLLWWAVEAHAESDRPAVLEMMRERSLWSRPMAAEFLIGRLMQRYAMAGGADNFAACAALLEMAPATKDADVLLGGLEKAFAGKGGVELPAELKKAVNRAWAAGATSSRHTLGLRVGEPRAVEEAMKLLSDTKAPVQKRQETIRIFGEVSEPRCVPALLELVKTGPKPLQQEALGALQRYDEARIGKEVLALYLDGKTFDEPLRESAQTLLGSRASWARGLLEAVDGGKLPPRALSMDLVRKVLLFKDEPLTKLVEKHWGKVRASTAEEKKRELLRVGGILKKGKGEAAAGKAVYANTCGKCHKLFNEGGAVGPELTGYERDNILYWLENVVDPSAAIRDEYMTFVVTTADGRTLTGLIAEQDKQAVTLKAADGQAVKLSRERIEDLRASQTSLMPEDQLRGLSEQQVRDLFAYLMSKK